MLINICMKFHEDTLNGFKVTERTQFCLRNCYLQSSKGDNSKSINTRVMVLAFCMKVHEGILNVFLVTEQTQPISQNLLFSISKGHNSKNMQSRVTVLALCTLSQVALPLYKVSWKYLKRFWSYRADTILWQTDDQGKNKMSLNPTRGDKINITPYGENSY